MKFKQPYHDLPSSMKQEISLSKSEVPSVFLYVNLDLVNTLDIEPILSQEGCELLSGFSSPFSIEPLSLAYAGHQFGYFTNLGDGRARVLGRYKGFDFSLKGTGPTKFSRGGDGLAPLASLIKETLYAHALSYLHIPSSRVLSMTYTHKHAFREQTVPAGVLCRLMRSNLRIGSIEYAAKFKGHYEVKATLDVAIATLWPTLVHDEKKYEKFAIQCMSQWGQLVAQWQSVGFVHGVLNTDNISLAYETIDFGPCAFLETVNLNKAYSSIDIYDRYAYNKQLEIIRFNARCFLNACEGILKDTHESQSDYTHRYLNVLDEHFEKTIAQLSAKKLGIVNPRLDLWVSLLEICDHLKLDFTQTFVDLTLHQEKLVGIDPKLDQWLNQLQEVVVKEKIGEDQRKRMMLSANPMIVLRHDLVNTIIDMCMMQDFTLFDDVMLLLKKPYDINHESHPLFKLSSSHIVTTCGT